MTTDIILRFVNIEDNLPHCDNDEFYDDLYSVPVWLQTLIHGRYLT